MKKLFCLILCITLISSTFIFSGCDEGLVKEFALETIDNALEKVQEESAKILEEQHVKEGCVNHYLPDLRDPEDSNIINYNGKKYYEGGNGKINTKSVSPDELAYIGETEVIGRFSGIYRSKLGLDGKTYCALVTTLANEENPEVLFRLSDIHDHAEAIYVREDIVFNYKEDDNYVNIPLKSINIRKPVYSGYYKVGIFAPIDFGVEEGEQSPIYIKDIVGERLEDEWDLKIKGDYECFYICIEFWEHKNLVYRQISLYIYEDEMIIEFDDDEMIIVMGSPAYKVKDEYKQAFLDAIAKYEEWEAQRKSSK